MIRLDQMQRKIDPGTDPRRTPDVAVVNEDRAINNGRTGAFAEHTRRELGPFSAIQATSLVSKTVLSFGLPPGTIIVSICSLQIS